jgi:transcriptional regulator with XRE-family HTH domain
VHFSNKVSKRSVVAYSLRDLRTAKNIKQKQLADYLGISKSLYHAIECGHRKPNIDTVFMLSMLYKTSMDFIYHAYNRQYIVHHFPDPDLKYALREANETDITYIYQQISPSPMPAPPKLPATLIHDGTAKADATKDGLLTPRLYSDNLTKVTLDGTV